MGGADGGAGQSGDDVPAAGALGAAAQKKTLVAREQDAVARAAWRVAAAGLNPADLVFLDETSTPTTLTPRRARAPRGQRAIGRVPRGRWEAITLVATLTPTGPGPAVVLPGALDRIAFDTYVAEVLVPELRPGQTVILDNLSVHKSATAQRLIEAAGCELRFLPTYSPDFNPIEDAFAKLKEHLRRAEARTFDAVVTATGTGLDAITASDARGYFTAAGFPLPPGQPL